jgi:8-amino-7-oxononanoate synthase
MTSLPWSLSGYLIALNMNVNCITFPTIPQGKDCLRICLHASNTKEEVEKLVNSAIRWAEEAIALQEQNPEEGSRILLLREAEEAEKVSNVALFQSKL